MHGSVYDSMHKAFAEWNGLIMFSGRSLIQLAYSNHLCKFYPLNMKHNLVLVGWMKIDHRFGVSYNGQKVMLICGLVPLKLHTDDTSA